MQPVFIISPEQFGMNEHQINIAHKSMQFELDTIGLPYKQVTGYYKGNPELSYVITATEWDMPKIEKLRDYYEQACFLYSDSRRYTTLHFANNHVEAIGQLRGVSKEVAHTYDSYTTDGENYWVAV